MFALLTASRRCFLPSIMQRKENNYSAELMVWIIVDKRLRIVGLKIVVLRVWLNLSNFESSTLKSRLIVVILMVVAVF